MLDHKKPSETLDGTPDKRMFWSIISDYNLKLGLCELIDNAIDLWQSNGRKQPLNVNVTVEADRQIITVHDDAGGVRKDELRFLVAPGGSRNDPDAPLIGIFGVGSKRAGVALGERVVITTRFRKETTYEVEISKQWLQSSSWLVDAYAVAEIEPGTTTVEISHVRKPFSNDDVEALRHHLMETYPTFFDQGLDLRLNGAKVLSRPFDVWAYPPEFLPKRTTFDINLGADGVVGVQITAGLMRERPPELEEYGVYFYCNGRLIAKELKSRDVGYITGQAGIPHSDASLCRVIVRLNGPARTMPWNSSKSGLNFSHPVFEQVRTPIIDLVSHFSALSRRLRDDWEGSVFRHKSGDVEDVDQQGIARTGRVILPPLPRAKRGPTETLKHKNKSAVQGKPWTLGLVEAIAAVEILQRQRLETKNRIALVVLDSTLEIGLKEFIVHRPDLFQPSKFTDSFLVTLFRNRAEVIKAVSAQVVLQPADLARAQHYYNLRNKLIHERATVEILDSDIEIYRRMVQRILRTLFGLRF